MDKLAGRLLGRMGCEDGNHTILRRNVAAGLQEAGGGRRFFERDDMMPADAAHAAVVDAFASDTPADGAYLAVTKLERDLELPYTDADVHARLKQLDGFLQETLQRLAEVRSRSRAAGTARFAAAAPTRLFTGSDGFAAARLGAAFKVARSVFPARATREQAQVFHRNGDLAYRC